MASVRCSFVTESLGWQKYAQISQKVFWDKEYQSVGSKSSLLSFQLKVVKSSIYRATYVERSECAL